MQHDISIVIVTVCRDSLLRAVRSVFTQTFTGRIQILVGVDVDPDQTAQTLHAQLKTECPAQIDLLWLNPGYSTSKRHGGVHTCFYGGSLRSALTLLANSEVVAYLDDDDWFAPEHIENLLTTIEGKTWAFSFSIYADGNTSQGLCIDTLESVGVNAGIFAERFGGFVRPSALAINKLALLEHLHLWSSSPFPTGDGEDRLIFDRLKSQPFGCTGAATVYYSLDPKDDMHATRLAFLKRKGIEFEASEKTGSTRQ